MADPYARTESRATELAERRLRYLNRFSADTVARGLRVSTARGTVVNAAFQIALAALVLVQRSVVAVFLTTAEFGLWGVLLTTILAVLFIKNIGIGDKFVQQDDANQEQAFQEAFTINFLLGLVAVGLAAIALPLFALAYGENEIIVPGLVLSLAIIGQSMQAPAWIFYRRMEFVKQRAMLSIEPVITFIVTVALAIAGMGYWALIIGALTGIFISGITCLAVCPYPIRFRLQRGTIREYYSFSWPLIVANGSNLAIVQGALLIATRTLGFAGAGAIGLAASIAAFTDGVDAIVTRTVYPAICAVADRTDLMFETFIKSNRLALMWGMPFGLGIALFAPDLIHFGLGDEWESAITVVQAFGIVAAIDQLGFNWAAFFRATNQTRPMAVVGLLNLATFAVITAPLLLAFGLDGFAVGLIIARSIAQVARTYYLTRLFRGYKLLRHASRAIAPVIPALAITLLVRLLTSGGERTPELAVLEATIFAAVTAAATVYLERALLREVLAYLRKPGTAVPATSG